MALALHQTETGDEQLISTPTSRKLTAACGDPRHCKVPVPSDVLYKRPQLEWRNNPLSPFAAAVKEMAEELRQESEKSTPDMAMSPPPSTHLYSPTSTGWKQVLTDIREKLHLFTHDVIGSAHPQLVEGSVECLRDFGTENLPSLGGDLPDILAMITADARQARTTYNFLTDADIALNPQGSREKELFLTDDRLTELAQMYAGLLCKNCSKLSWDDNLDIYGGTRERVCVNDGEASSV